MPLEDYDIKSYDIDPSKRETDKAIIDAMDDTGKDSFDDSWRGLLLNWLKLIADDQASYTDAYRACIQCLNKFPTEESVSVQDDWECLQAHIEEAIEKSTSFDTLLDAVLAVTTNWVGMRREG